MFEEPGPVRVSTTERERVISVLRTALAEGMLTLEEAEEREAVVYAARYRHELDAVLTDLPRALHWRTPEATAARRRWGRYKASAGLVLLGALIGGVAATGHFFWPLIPIVLIGLAIAKKRHWYRHGGFGYPHFRGGSCHGRRHHGYRHRTHGYKHGGPQAAPAA